MMRMMNLQERIEKALLRLEAQGVTGWGLSVYDGLGDLGEIVQVGPIDGCCTDMCSHESHDPAAPEYKWVPNEGRLVRLGNDGEDDYYVLLRDDEALFLRLLNPRHFHARLRVIDPDRVPDYLLAAAVAGG